MRNTHSYLLLLTVLCFMWSCRPEPAKTGSTDDTTTDPVTVPTVEPDNRIIIGDGEVYGISPGADIVSLGTKLKAGILKSGEGEFDVYYIIGPDGEEIGHLTPNSLKDDSTVEMIFITAEGIPTTDGLAVGSTYADILKVYPDAEVHGSEIEGRTSAVIGGMSFLLDAYHFNYDLEGVAIDPGTKIKVISLFEPYNEEEAGKEMSENLTKLQGRWQSLDDPNSFVTYEYTTKLEEYIGMEGSMETVISVDDRCLDGENSDSDPDRYINEEDSEFCYYIISLTEDELELSYVGAGNILKYKKVE